MLAAFNLLFEDALNVAQFRKPSFVTLGLKYLYVVYVRMYVVQMLWMHVAQSRKIIVW